MEDDIRYWYFVQWCRAVFGEKGMEGICEPTPAGWARLLCPASAAVTHQESRLQLS